MDVFQQGYREEYHGHDTIVTPTLLTLNKHATAWRKAEYLAPCTSLIGPTMCGKTRLVMELADEICVVHICLRPYDDDGEPKRSQLATEFLQTPRSADLEKYYTRLTTSILSVVIRFFEDASESKAPKDVLQEWYKHHTSTNTDFYSNVQSAFEQTALTTDPVHQLELTAQKAGQTRILERSPLKVLLAIDEAKALFDKPSNERDPDAKPRSHFFHRALRNLPDTSGVFAILVDTDSCVANFNPRGANQSTSRPISLCATPSKLYPPIYQIRSFDQMVSPKPPRFWDELFVPERLCKYGVPFFSVHFRLLIEGYRVLDPAGAVRKISRLALTILLDSHPSDPIKITESQALALLGPTIGVILSDHARQNAVLMASHAAHCGYIDTNTHRQFSFYPSQPIYALAANDYLHKNEDALISCINSLTTVLSDDPRDTGVVTEIASRIILLCAMNKTAADLKSPKENSKDSARMQDTAFPDPVPVTKFLETLTGLSAEELPLGSIDTNHKRKLFKQGMMFWNHFMHTPQRPKSALLLKCLERGVALQCQSGESVFNQVLSIYLKEGSNAELDEANTTFCGIRSNSRTKDCPVETSQEDMTPEAAHIDLSQENNPYLALYFCLKDAPFDTGSDTRRDHYRLPSYGDPDPRQATLVFYGVDSFHFLSLGVKNALKELIKLPIDLVSQHGHSEIGQQYAKDLLLGSRMR
ncbi:hypothetical protein PTTG_12444 [Puccinia triticina 1-1 BBBD Race 1]|uniref:Uncharacterized protein n=1 Tax=Puccinia triticina (isolate 1-1 / race 1 (BBBD)) TaxID=630390 RepID=A0A180G5Y6_PUCT1|nr:hypothetical protein PTTG_12444 [Puccinia triticina 1-1 BBBD Race 1]